MAGHQTIWTALRTAVGDRMTIEDEVQPIPAGLCIEGKTCLVTGASSGLGKAVAIDLASRGGKLIMVCRPGHGGLVEAISASSGSSKVEMLEADLSDLDSVARVCDELRTRAQRIHIAVLNAGLMPSVARKSRQGFELMFAVHFLANRLLAERMLADGILAPAGGGEDASRLVFVSSEAHRSASPINFEKFAEFTPYGVKDGLKYYGLSKLHLTTYFAELSRRLAGQGSSGVKVHALCPGPVASGIAREAPGLLRPLVSLVMKLFFLQPAKAAVPVMYLCCAEDAGKRSGIYLHLLREKAVSRLASDEENGRRLIEASDVVMAEHMSAPHLQPEEKKGAQIHG